jgi:carbamoylphosphate synthase small subunit
MRDPMRRPPDCNAALVLADATVFWGRGLGANGTAVGEVCFNTAITGYQEILTDPSYAGQIITFTFPHIGNVGANREDIETTTPAARGLVLRTPDYCAGELPRDPVSRHLAETQRTDRDFGGGHAPADPAHS